MKRPSTTRNAALIAFVLLVAGGATTGFAGLASGFVEMDGGRLFLRTLAILAFIALISMAFVLLEHAEPMPEKSKRRRGR